MSQETWEILCEMEADDVELQLALQCAPLITGLKISNLLTISPEGFTQVGRIVEGSVQEMAKSLSLLAELPLPDATKVLPGHEGFSTLGQERSTNPYMNGAWY